MIQTDSKECAGFQAGDEQTLQNYALNGYSQPEYYASENLSRYSRQQDQRPNHASSGERPISKNEQLFPQTDEELLIIQQRVNAQSFGQGGVVQTRSQAEKRQQLAPQTVYSSEQNAKKSNNSVHSKMFQEPNSDELDHQPRLYANEQNQQVSCEHWTVQHHITQTNPQFQEQGQMYKSRKDEGDHSQSPQRQVFQGERHQIWLNQQDTSSENDNCYNRRDEQSFNHIQKNKQEVPSLWNGIQGESNSNEQVEQLVFDRTHFKLKEFIKVLLDEQQNITDAQKNLFVLQIYDRMAVKLNKILYGLLNYSEAICSADKQIVSLIPYYEDLLQESEGKLLKKKLNTLCKTLLQTQDIVGDISEIILALSN